MPLQVVESTRLYRQIANQIASLIDRGEFAVGSRLPPERSLAKELGVSRTSVREAILALEIEGRIEVRVGTGIFVVQPEVQAAPEGGPGPFELLAARMLVEGETAALAARRIGDDALAVLHETVTTMRAQDDDHAARDRTDRDFHMTIAEASGNSALALLVSTLWEQRQSGLWPTLANHFQTPELRALTLEDHEAIIDSLAARDSRAARAAMTRHLHHVEHVFQRCWERSGVRSTQPSGTKLASRAATAP
jgi:DNA-binding FadR family transcriptional regulator